MNRRALDIFALANRVELPRWEPPPTGGEVLNLTRLNNTIEGATPILWSADKMEGINRPDNSIAGIYALHVLNHVADPVRLLRECERVLMPFGTVNIVVPYYASQTAHDMATRTYWTERTLPDLLPASEDKWNFELGFQAIVGVDERALCLVAQLVKSNSYLRNARRELENVYREQV